MNCFNKVDMVPMSVIDPKALEASNPDMFIANPDMSGVEGVPRYFWKVDGRAVVEMNQAEKDAVTAAELAPAKVAKAVEIMNNTTVVIATGGFVYDSKTFALSVPEMVRFDILTAGKAFLTYPFYLPTKDGQDFVQFDGVNDLQAFQKAMTEAIDGYQQGEKIVVDQINALTDLEAVKNFVDPRL